MQTGQRQAGLLCAPCHVPRWGRTSTEDTSGGHRGGCPPAERTSYRGGLPGKMFPAGPVDGGVDRLQIDAWAQGVLELPGDRDSGGRRARRWPGRKSPAGPFRAFGRGPPRFWTGVLRVPPCSACLIRSSVWWALGGGGFFLLSSACDLSRNSGRRRGPRRLDRHISAALTCLRHVNLVKVGGQGPGFGAKPARTMWRSGEKR